MNQEEKNEPAGDEQTARDEEIEDENSIILTEENAPVLFDDTAESDEDDIELIDLTKEEEE